MYWKAQNKAQLKAKIRELNLRVIPDGKGNYLMIFNASFVNGNMIQEMLKLSKDMKLDYREEKTGHKYTNFLLDSRVYDEYVKDVDDNEEVIVYL